MKTFQEKIDLFKKEIVRMEEYIMALQHDTFDGVIDVDNFEVIDNLTFARKHLENSLVHINLALGAYSGEKPII